VLRASGTCQLQVFRERSTEGLRGGSSNVPLCKARETLTDRRTRSNRLGRLGNVRGPCPEMEKAAAACALGHSISRPRQIHFGFENGALLLISDCLRVTHRSRILTRDVFIPFRFYSTRDSQQARGGTDTLELLFCRPFDEGWEFSITWRKR
jgi:hypothetical protein